MESNRYSQHKGITTGLACDYEECDDVFAEGCNDLSRLDEFQARGLVITIKPKVLGYDVSNVATLVFFNLLYIECLKTESRINVCIRKRRKIMN